MRTSKSMLWMIDDEGNPYHTENVIQWGEWMANNEKRTIEHTRIDDFIVSTVFLGVDHNFSGEGPPILWETMVFKKRGSGFIDGMSETQVRYSSLEEAKEGHAKIVDTVTRILVRHNEKFGK